jgi:ABC-type multidrug transport system ATPase subunit
MGSVTVLVIAHRLTTIKDADKIVVLKDGVKREEGNHDYLISEHPEGIYAHLVELEGGKEALKKRAHEDEHLVDHHHIDEDDMEHHELDLKKKRTRKRTIGGKTTDI